MPTAIVLMILGALGYAWWNASRAAAERAERLGREACRAAGVQWLDQTVHVTGIRLCRHDDGHGGRMTLRGGRLVTISGPVMPPPGEIEH